VPRALYERPGTRFVADFVGTNNLVPGDVSGRRGDTVLVATGLGPMEAIAGGDLPARCVLAIRPENVDVRPAALDAAGLDGNRVAGRVSLVSYLGNTLRYDIDVGDGQVFKADVRDPWHHEPLSLGSPVVLRFAATVTLAIADDAPC
jgi:ABC-type Fe3+/spermidine/putrescine transport system ATPase subunit